MSSIFDEFLSSFDVELHGEQAAPLCVVKQATPVTPVVEQAAAAKERGHRRTPARPVEPPHEKDVQAPPSGPSSDKISERMHRNRLSAAESRTRKREYVSQLEERCLRYERELCVLREEMRSCDRAVAESKK